MFEIIKITSFNNDEVVYVGDSLTDIQTAKNAGIDCILVDWGYGNFNNFSDENVLKIINTPNKLKKKLSKQIKKTPSYLSKIISFFFL